MDELSEWDVIVVGGANTDYLVRGPNLPAAGETVHGDTFQEGPGGKGANQAVAAARLKATVAFIACVGTDSRGDKLLEALAAEGVGTQYVRRTATAPTGVALVHLETGGQKQILVAPGANQELLVADVLAATEALARTRVLLTQLEVPLPAIMTAMRLAQQSGAQIILDAAPPVEVPDELLQMVDVLRANTDEAEQLTGIKPQDRESARQAIGVLRQRGVNVAIVPVGSEGNLLVGPEGEQWLPLLEVNTVDTTGAGDAFAGALAVALAEGWPLEKASPFANSAAALATTEIGAQPSLPRRDEVDALLEQQE